MGRGGAQLGKALKGGGAPMLDANGVDTLKRAKVLNDIQNEDLLIVKQNAILHERYEQMRAARLKLDTIRHQERFVLNLNVSRSFDKWRALFRAETADMLKRMSSDIKIIVVDHTALEDRHVDDRMGQLDALSDASHDRFMDHRIAVDKLSIIFNRHFSFLVYYCERLFNELVLDFQSSIRQINEAHSIALHGRQAIESIGQQEYQSIVFETDRLVDSEKETIRNHQLESINNLRIVQDSVIDRLENEFETAHKRYVAETDEKCIAYQELRARDESMSKDIEVKLRRIDMNAFLLSRWKKKVASRRNEGTLKNSELKRQKLEMMAHFRILKQHSNEARNVRMQHLKSLCIGTSVARDSLNATLRQLRIIIGLNKTCVEMQTVYEQIAPMVRIPIASAFGGEVIVNELREEGKPFSRADNGNLVDNNTVSRSSSISQEFQSATDFIDNPAWHALDEYYKRINHAKEYNISLKTTLESLRSQNRALKNSVAQFLNGINVSDDIMRQTNTLFVINGRVRIELSDEPSKVAIHAGTIVKQYAAQGYSMSG